MRKATQAKKSVAGKNIIPPLSFIKHYTQGEGGGGGDKKCKTHIKKKKKTVTIRIRINKNKNDNLASIFKNPSHCNQHSSS
jgi:hypothetical protein